MYTRKSVPDMRHNLKSSLLASANFTYYAIRRTHRVVQKKFCMFEFSPLAAVSSEAWAKLRDWASVAARGRLLLSGSFAHASL